MFHCFCSRSCVSLHNIYFPVKEVYIEEVKFLYIFSIEKAIFYDNNITLLISYTYMYILEYLAIKY